MSVSWTSSPQLPGRLRQELQLRVQPGQLSETLAQNKNKNSGDVVPLFPPPTMKNKTSNRQQLDHALKHVSKERQTHHCVCSGHLCPVPMASCIFYFTHFNYFHLRRVCGQASQGSPRTIKGKEAPFRGIFDLGISRSSEDAVFTPGSAINGTAERDNGCAVCLQP